MKALYWLMIVVLLSEHIVAQTDDRSYNIWSIGGGAFFRTGSTGGIETAFPYTVTSVVTGITTTQTFSSGLRRSYFARPLGMGNLSTLTILRKRFSVDLGLGNYRSGNGENGFYFQTGYRRIFPIGPLLLGPGFDLYAFIGGKKSLGAIDNRQKEISLFGYRAPDRYPVTISSYDYTSETDTINAGQLNIDYRRSALLLEPKLTLSTRPIRGMWVISMEAGWMLPLEQSAEMEFVQADGPDGHNPNNIGGINLKPGSGFSGPYVSLNVGLAWGIKKKP
jgi:hypothetical protein